MDEIPHPRESSAETFTDTDSVVTVRVRPPFRLIDAFALQEAVRALVARRPTAVVLDVDGLLPMDEFSVLMLHSVVRDAAEEGIPVVLANAAPAFQDRLFQLGVHDVTFTAPASPTETCEQEAAGHDDAPPSPLGPRADGLARPHSFDTPWARRAPPCASSTASEMWRDDLVSPAAITFSRTMLRRRILAAPPLPGMHEDDVDVLLLAYEELASNAIRHGRPPVRAVVTAMEDYWLIDVVDGATDCVPEPPVDRDPAQGGLGLHLVARLSTTYGWWTERDRKHVWACVRPGEQSDPAQAPGAGAGPDPR